MTRHLDTLAQRLSHARKKRGMRQVELAEASGLKQSDISKLETGKATRTTGIARLARALKVPDQWLELNEGHEPDWEAKESQAPAAPPVEQLQLGTGLDWLPEDERALLLAYRDLFLPEIKTALVKPILDRAAEMRHIREELEKRHGPTNPVPDHELEHLRAPAHVPPAPRYRPPTPFQEGVPPPAPRHRKAHK